MIIVKTLNLIMIIILQPINNNYNKQQKYRQVIKLLIMMMDHFMKVISIMGLGMVKVNLLIMMELYIAEVGKWDN